MNYITYTYLYFRTSDCFYIHYIIDYVNYTNISNPFYFIEVDSTHITSKNNYCAWTLEDSGDGHNESKIDQLKYSKSIC